MVTPNREQLRYDETAKQLILDKIELAKKELIELSKSDAAICTTISEYVKLKDSPYRMIKLTEGISLKIGFKEKYGKNPRTGSNYEWYKEIAIPDLHPISLKGLENLGIEIPTDNPYFPFYVSAVYSNGRLLKKENSTKVHKCDHIGRGSLYRIKGEVVTRKNSYLQNFALVRKSTLSFNQWNKALGLVNTPYMQNGLNKVKLFQKVKKVLQDYLVEQSHSYEQTNIPKEWIDSQRERRVTNKLGKNEINVTYFSTGVEEKEILDLNKVKSELIIYDLPENKKLIKEIALMLSGKKSLSYAGNWRNVGGLHKHKIRVFTTAKSNHKYLVNQSNCMTGEEFISNRNKVFIKTITAHYIRENMTDKIQLTHYAYRKICAEHTDRIAELSNYVGRHTSNARYCTTEFLSECYTMMEENNWWDEEIRDTLKQVLKYEEGLKLLTLISSRDVEGNSDLIIDFMKLKKKKLNAEHYIILQPHEEELLEQAKQIIAQTN